jgi:hypothetical protein
MTSITLKPGDRVRLNELGASRSPKIRVRTGETEEVLIKSKVISTIPLMPSRITIMSETLAWPSIEIAAGRTTVLRPARITASGANHRNREGGVCKGDRMAGGSQVLNFVLDRETRSGNSIDLVSGLRPHRKQLAGSHPPCGHGFSAALQKGARHWRRCPPSLGRRLQDSAIRRAVVYRKSHTLGQKLTWLPRPLLVQNRPRAGTTSALT